MHARTTAASAIRLRHTQCHAPYMRAPTPAFCNIVDCRTQGGDKFCKADGDNVSARACTVHADNDSHTRAWTQHTII